MAKRLVERKELQKVVLKVQNVVEMMVALLEITKEERWAA
jgi:hypothetical protein